MSVEHVERLRVAWIDTDAGGRIHFSNAFRWAEAAEVGLVRSVLSVEEWADFPRKHVQAEFLKVLRFDDEIEVRIRVDRIGTTSITYAWTISKDGEPLHPRRPHRRARRRGRPSVAHPRPDPRRAVRLALFELSLESLERAAEGTADPADEHDPVVQPRDCRRAARTRRRGDTRSRPRRARSGARAARPGGPAACSCRSPSDPARTRSASSRARARGRATASPGGRCHPALPSAIRARAGRSSARTSPSSPCP